MSPSKDNTRLSLGPSSRLTLEEFTFNPRKERIFVYLENGEGNPRLSFRDDVQTVPRIRLCQNSGGHGWDQGNSISDPD